jgi:hypothetical protein
MADSHRLLLRLEGAAVFAAAVWAYAALGASWWLFALLLLVPDVSMLGYLAGPRVGAWSYNAAHTYLFPAALAAVSLLSGWTFGLALALIGVAHIGMDRTLGYGLKQPSGFHDTHLSPPRPADTTEPDAVPAASPTASPLPPSATLPTVEGTERWVYTNSGLR